MGVVVSCVPSEAAFVRFVRRAVRDGVVSSEDCARALGLSRSAFSRRMSGKVAWRLDEAALLWELIKPAPARARLSGKDEK